MNIEALVRNAVDELKGKCVLPKTGFIAGGSIANILWQYVSNNEAVINDIDIFIESEKQDNAIFKWEKKELTFDESYLSIGSRVDVKERYEIYSVQREGLLNLIYISKDTQPDCILKSFDINCTAVGYSLDTDKVHFLPCFVDFLNTGKLQSINLSTPAHTAIRMAKKKYELNAEVEEKEFRIIQICNLNLNTMLSLSTRALPLADITRLRFKKKYADIYLKYTDLLGKYFNLHKVDSHDSDKDEFKEMFDLHLVEDDTIAALIEKVSDYFKHRNFLLTTDNILYYFRKIEGDEKLEKAYNKLFYFFSNDFAYIDVYDPILISKIVDFCEAHPKCIKNLRGYKISEQNKIIDSVMDKIVPMFCKQTAIEVIANKKIEPDKELNEFDIMLLGLSVRKKVFNPLSFIDF